MADTIVAIYLSVHHTSTVACRCQDRHQSSESMFICVDFFQCGLIPVICCWDPLLGDAGLWLFWLSPLFFFDFALIAKSKKSSTRGTDISHDWFSQGPAVTIWAAGCDWGITGNDCESYFVWLLVEFHFWFRLPTLESVGNFPSLFRWQPTGCCLRFNGKVNVADLVCVVCFF